jgi:hypothetical protein
MALSRTAEITDVESQGGSINTGYTLLITNMYVFVVRHPAKLCRFMILRLPGGESCKCTPRCLLLLLYIVYSC